MKTKVLGIAAMIGLASCSNNEELSTPKQENVIGFNIAVNKAITRSPINGATAMQSHGFDVWGYRVEDYHQQVGANNSPVLAKYSNAAWNLTEAAYWPESSKKVAFYAIWPTVDYETNTAIKGTQQTVEYTRKSAEKLVHDLMYAMKVTNRDDAPQGKVSLYFKHALSQVQFKGKVAANGLVVKVKSLQICNLKNKGSFTFPTNETTSSSSHGTWGSLLNPGTDYTATMDNEASLNSISDAVVLGDPFLIVPQAFTPWTTSSTSKKSITEADKANESYLKLEVHITQNGEDILGSTSAYASTFIPLPQPADKDFKSGKKYTYTLKFGGGKKEDGDDQFAPIEFDVDVEPWSETPDKEMNL